MSRKRENTKSKSFWALFNNNNKMIIWRKWGEARRRDNIFGTVVFLWMFCLFYNVLGIIFTIIALFCTLLLTLRQQNVPYWLRTYRTCSSRTHRTKKKDCSFLVTPCLTPVSYTKLKTKYFLFLSYTLTPSLLVREKYLSNIGEMEHKKKSKKTY